MLYKSDLIFKIQQFLYHNIEHVHIISCSHSTYIIECVCVKIATDGWGARWGLVKRGSPRSEPVSHLHHYS